MGPPPVAFAGISRLRPQGAPLRSAESLDPYVYVHIGTAARKQRAATPRVAAVEEEVADEGHAPGLVEEELVGQRGGGSGAAASGGAEEHRGGGAAGRPEAGASGSGNAAIARPARTSRRG